MRVKSIRKKFNVFLFVCLFVFVLFNLSIDKATKKKKGNKDFSIGTIIKIPLETSPQNNQNPSFLFFKP